MRETQVRSLGWEDSLEKGLETHSNIVARRSPRTEEPGGLQSLRLQSRTQLSNKHFHIPETKMASRLINYMPVQHAMYCIFISITSLLMRNVCVMQYIFSN